MNYIYIDQSFEEIINDLSEYTQMSIEKIRNLVTNRQPYCYKREFVNKQDFESNHFYNLSSRYFIFGNAKHGTYIDDISKIIDIVPNNETFKMFEFGCGTANISFAIKRKFGDRVEIYYNELSAIQKDFAKWRFDKYNLKAQLVDSWNLDKLQDNYFHLIISLDVFEHIIDYPKYVNKICSKIKNGWFLWEGTYFLQNIHNDPTHGVVEDKYNFEGIIKNAGFTKYNSIKLSEGNLWKKST